MKNASRFHWLLLAALAVPLSTAHSSLATDAVNQGKVGTSARVLRILPLGDSITRGSYLKVSADGPDKGKAIGLPHRDGGGYRKPLQDKLNEAGIAFDFVGELDYGAYGANAKVDPTFDPDHHGLAGFSNARILSGGAVPTPIDVLDQQGIRQLTVPGIAEVLKDHQPDVVLLMSGANGFNSTDRDRLIRAIGEHNSAYLFVATLLPQKPPRAGWDQVSEYNESLASIVEVQKKAGRKIAMVNMYEAISTDELLSDGVHPTKAGMAKMAEVWFESMEEAGVLRSE